MRNDIRWHTTAVGNLIADGDGEIKTGPFGTKLKASEYTETGVPVISVGEIGLGEIVLHDRTPRVDNSVTDRMPEYILREGDIVFGRKGAVERSAIVRSYQDGWFLGSDGIRLRLPSYCDQRFIAYQFLSTQHKTWMHQQALGSTMPSLNQKIISRIPIVLPPIEVQRAIASILGTLDDKIELNRRMNETLDSMSRAIFKNRFIDATTVLTAAQKADLPVHWELKTVSDILADERGISVGVMYPGKHDPDGVPLIKAGDLSGGFLNRNPSFRVTPAKHREYRRTEFRGGEILMTLVGNLGQCAIVPPEMQGWNAARAVAVIRVADASSVAFVKQWLESRPIQDLMHAWANTTVQPTINLREIRKLPIFWPPDQVRSEFADAVEPMMLRVNANIRESSKLAALRDTLLPKLLSGELPIPDALKQAEAVL